MSAQPAEQAADPRVPPFPRTIDAVRAAIPDEQQRKQFLAQVLATPAEDLQAVVSARWFELMLDRVPGADRRLADARLGVNQVPLPELLLVDGE
jgi:predicted component of type VI protein secretion system